jgi:hypothetical protein
MESIIGRKEEIAVLQALKASKKAEFVAIYGRRRVGKTYLVRTVFEGQFSFQLSGSANTSKKHQLTNFHNELMKISPNSPYKAPPKDWFDAFFRLSVYLEKLPVEKKIIFFDELPWFDSHNSGFVPALEYFWNSWASARRDVLLIACGSAASWIINKVINNKGGLHNRLTERIVLHPFTLLETEAFLQAKGGIYTRYELAELYMILGGIPYYLENLQMNRSIAQNIDRMLFTAGGFLTNEYANLYRSLFLNYEKHSAVVEVLTKKASGMLRKELLELAGLPNNGGSTIILEELENSGFIKRYLPFGKAKRDALYQLVDQFTLFYHAFVKDSKAGGEGAWMSQINSPKWQAWSGYAFESLCAYHIKSIKKALGISGVYTEISAWRSMKSEKGAQIDLIIDRNDRIITICEMKFASESFTITKDYAEKLQHKIFTFRNETETKKTVFLTMITANGLVQNQYSMRWVQESLELDALFL